MLILASTSDILRVVTSATASLARTAIGATGWAAATAATPSVKAN